MPSSHLILSSPSPPAPNPSQHQSLFQWVNSSQEVAKVLEFQLQHQSFQWTPRTDLLSDGLVGSPCSPRDLQESSPALQIKSINSSALSFLHSPTLTSIHDHWKNHSLDYVAAAAKLLQSCPTLCDPIDGSPLGSSVPGILQARILEWVAISFSNVGKWKVKVKSLSHVRPSEIPWTAAYQAPLSMGFSRQEYWSGVPLPSPKAWNRAIQKAYF